MNDKNIKEINKTTDLISSLIHEYLFKKDYLKTLDIFQQELSEKIKSGNFYNLLNNNTYDYSSLINYFENGNKHKFMEQWKRIIPNNLKLTETTLFKLDFNIEIYFAIYPILKPNASFNDSRIQKNMKQNMEEFKSFLEQNQTEQFKTPEFLSYYALPYIPDPRKNSNYANLFKPEWTKCLKEQIQRCINYYSPSNINKFPILYDLTRGKKIITINNNTNIDDDNINSLKDVNNNLKDINIKNEEKIKELIKEKKIINEENKNLIIKDCNNKKKYIDTQKTWCNLALDIINYSFDLLEIYNKITNNQKNNTIDEINNKLIKYQNFLVKNLEELEKNSKNININENNILKEKYQKELDKLDNIKYNNNVENKIILNYSPNNNKLKDFDNCINSEKKKNNINTKNNNMINTSNKKNKPNSCITFNYDNKLLNMKKFIDALNHNIYIEDTKLSHIFQEIRFRIDKKENPNLRQITLFEIFYYDLFGTLSNNSNIFKQLLSNKNLNVEVMKLVNSLANFNKGKNYLLSKNTLIEDIVKCMIAEKNDTELRQNCLGVLQKFSLRIESQNKLIELNVIHYLVDIFTYQSEKLSDYTIEYGLALLMNLSLRKEGKEKFEAVSEKIIKILLKFLNYENIQILTCINGMLYSLIMKKKIREQAIKYGVEQKLEQLKKFNEEQLNKQVKYIINELNNYSENNNEYNDDNNKREEESFIEEDINAKDNLDLIYNEYPENNIFNEKYIEIHYKILSEFIIIDNNMNLNEKEKIINFMNENTNMTKWLLNNNSNRSNDSSFGKDENNIKDGNEEEIINTNINEENNEYIEDYEGQNQNENNIINENNNDFDDIYGRPDDGFAFKTKDKLKRTPPRQIKYI